MDAVGELLLGITAPAVRAIPAEPAEKNTDEGTLADPPQSPPYEWDGPSRLSCYFPRHWSTSQRDALRPYLRPCLYELSAERLRGYCGTLPQHLDGTTAYDAAIIREAVTVGAALFDVLTLCLAALRAVLLYVSSSGLLAQPAHSCDVLWAMWHCQHVASLLHATAAGLSQFVVFDQRQCEWTGCSCTSAATAQAEAFDAAACAEALRVLQHSSPREVLDVLLNGASANSRVEAVLCVQSPASQQPPEVVLLSMPDGVAPVDVHKDVAYLVNFLCQ